MSFDVKDPVYQQNLLQIALILLEKIKNKIRTFEPEIG